MKKNHKNRKQNNRKNKRETTSAPKQLALRVVVARVFAFTWKSCKGIYVFQVLAGLVFTGAIVLGMHFLRILIDRLPAFIAGEVSFGRILFIIIIMGLVEITCAITNGLSNILFEYQLNRTSGTMTEEIHKKAKKMPLLNFESSLLYDDLEKANNGKDNGIYAMEDVIFSIIFHGGYFLFFSLYFVWIRPEIVLGVIASFIPVAISRVIRASSFYKAENRVAALRREYKVYESYISGRDFARETRTAGAVPFFRKLYYKALNKYSKEMLRTEKKTGLIDLGLRIFSLTGYMGMILLCTHYLMESTISAGIFSAVYFSLYNIFRWFDELFGRLGEAMRNGAYASNYLRFMDEDSDKPLVPTTMNFGENLNARDISFVYPGMDEPALKGISLEIKKGETVAIVGPNGAGKTTLAKILMGLLPATKGTVHIGGQLLSESEDQQYEGVSAVFQDFQRYALSIHDNVAIADLQKSAGGCENTVESNGIKKALGNANFPETEQFRWGMNTVLTKEFGTTELSGGQWQRLAIARGLYRTSNMIVLDEPTAAIDPLEETLVYKRFVEAAQDKTAVIITHRLGSAQVADRILVMDQGKIVEEGKHSQLMAAGGFYAELYNSQAGWYADS